MDREWKTQRPGASTAEAPTAAAPGRSTLVEAMDQAETPAIPRLELRPSGTGTGSGQRASAPAAPQAAAAQPAAPSATAAPQASASPVTHRTEHVAPDGGTRTRTTVAVGEVVHFTATAAGAWRAGQVGASGAATGTGTEYRWKAPSVAGPVTITFTPSSPGQAPVPTEMRVIAPTVDYRNATATAFPNQHRGAAGVMMHSRVVFGPDSVAFANTMWSEDPGPPTGMSGYFQRWRPQNHRPEPDPIGIDQHNHGPIDEAGYWDLASTDFGDGGSFEWAIPTNYTVFGETQAHLIRRVDQHFTLAPDGTMTVTKGSSHITRRP